MWRIAKIGKSSLLEAIFRKDESRSQLWRNFRWLLVGDILAKVFIFASTIYLARVLEDEGFGKLSFVQAFMIYAMVIAEFGLPTYGVREVAKSPERVIELSSAIQATRLALTIGICCAGTLLAYLFAHSVEMRWLFIFSLLGLIPYSSNVEWAFRGLGKMQYVALGNFIQQASFALLVFLLVHSANDLIAVPLYRTLGSLIAAGVLLWFLSRNLGWLKTFRENFWPRFSLYKAALPLGVSYVLVQIYCTFDTIMLGFMDRPEVVGWYNAGYKIINAFLGLNALVVSAFFPQLTATFLSEDKRGDFKKTLADFKSVIVAFSVLILIIVPLARPIMHFLYGEQYMAGVLAFQILLIYTAVALYSSLYGNTLLAMKKEKDFLAAVSVGALINLLLNFILIPRYHLNGAAAATLISELFVLGLMAGGYRRVKRT